MSWSVGQTGLSEIKNNLVTLMAQLISQRRWTRRWSEAGGRGPDGQPTPSFQAVLPKYFVCSVLKFLDSSFVTFILS